MPKRTASPLCLGFVHPDLGIANDLQAGAVEQTQSIDQ